MNEDDDRISQSGLTDIGGTLRTAREAQGRSLDEIAAATRINRHFLDDIEHGVFPRVPATYVRAFIRTYAREVGLDGDALLQSAVSVSQRTEPSSRTGAGGVIVAGRIPSVGKRRQMGVLFVIILLLVAGLVALVLWMRQERTAPSTQEVSFSDVVKEQESELKQSVNRSDSLGASPISSIGAGDSLVLEGVATESVWVKLRVDGAKPVEYTFAPLVRMRWRAKDSLVVSVGNASAMSFTLNSRRLGTLGSMKKPLRNVVFSRETLRRLQ